MKKSLSKALTVAAVVAMLMAALAPGASAKSRGDAERLTVAPAETRHENCIIDDFNNCPPEPWEHIAICVTTSLLSTDECPEVWETDEDDNRIGSFAQVRSDDRKARLPAGDCVA